MTRSLLAACLFFFIFLGCNTRSAVHKEGLYFTLLNSSETNIDFNNKISESDSVNVFENEYMYNGSGVGIGDFNNDGLADIFFGGSMVSSKLYINKGNFVFEDITAKAGIQTDQWCTGINVIDINSDGLQDIYICSSHEKEGSKRKNLLYINEGNLRFTEQAAQYGLADTGYSTQSAFFDYDKDGDLDMYLLNHRLYDNTANNLMPKDTSGRAPAQDRLYRNEGMLPGKGHPYFTDVSSQSGIKEDGYGLGIVVTDVNNDNWPDVYVANDYLGNDLLWLNNQDGSFTNNIATALRHQSYNSMGVDAADINNDALPDLAVVDMMPEDNERKKMMFNVASQEKYDMQQRMGYEPAFVRNMLQLHNGFRKNGKKQEPFYSEIGQLAGISETDWSWSVLMADFDNDGWKDMHITNGLAKDVTNNDFATFKNERFTGNYTFAAAKPSGKLDKNTVDLLRKNLDEYGSIKVENYFFRNKGDLTFSNETEKAGLAIPSVSNGAAYSDLDNDGDLDLVVNNMNQEAFVYRNELRKSGNDSLHHFLNIQLVGPASNPSGIGAKVVVYAGGATQFLEQSPVRGFSSSVDYRLHFGMGQKTFADSIRIQWPDNKVQLIPHTKANQFLRIRYTDAKAEGSVNQTAFSPALLNEFTDLLRLDFSHAESQYYDYGSQRGLLQKYSQLGPCMATGDINGDGLEDFFVGGAAYQSGKLFFQQPNGSFQSQNLVEGMKPEEDLSVSLFDADGDQDLDLLISGGSSEFGQNSPNNLLRLYTNNGKGRFTLNTAALPPGISLISKGMATADYDGDGDTDIFLGGYMLPQKYPQVPRSYLLQNNKGSFTDVTQQVCPALLNPGLITDALWTDYNKDNYPDLLVCGEWMPLKLFRNEKGKLVEVGAEKGIGTGTGMWRSLQEVDMDKDGDMDYVAGNMGQNNKYRINSDKPMMIYTKDVDKNGTEDIIPAYYLLNSKGDYELFPDADRNQLAERFPSVKKKYLLHKDFSEVDMEQLTSDFGAEGWNKLKCENAKTIWIENKGKDGFQLHDLPIEAQFAPVNAILSCDVDNDGNTDLIIAGNEYETDAMIGRYDASYGLVLKGNGKGRFLSVPMQESGFILDGDVKDLKLLRLHTGGKVVLASRNNDKLKGFLFTKEKR